MNCHRRTQRATVLASLLVIASLSTACKDMPTASAIRWEIERQLPGIQFERETNIRLGRFTMALVKKVARLAAKEDQEDLAMLSHIRKVNVASYRVEESSDHATFDALDLDDRFERRLASHGWENMMRVREDDERTWIFYRTGPNDSIRNLFVVTLDAYDLTVIGIEGRLDRLVAEALADDPDGFLAIVGP